KFERALAEGTVADTLNRFESKDGDFFFLEARTVHALGENTLVYEIQQTSNITFRVFDWGRMGLDGKPRPLHVAESLETIDFSRSGFGPKRPAFAADARGGETRVLAECPYFSMEERRGETLKGAATGRCVIVVGIAGKGRLATAGGELSVGAMETALVPAAAGAWTLTADGDAGVTALVATPRF
ncbi:MAG TPA: mannose-6-phosphate isomerase, partial [Polyangia bacterium]